MEEAQGKISFPSNPSLQVNPEAIRAMMSSWGRLGGLTTSAARAKASRENGKLGGRPPKKGNAKWKQDRALRQARRASVVTADPSPKEGARAITKEEALPGDKVRLTFQMVLARRDAEALSAVLKMLARAVSPE